MNYSNELISHNHALNNNNNNNNNDDDDHQMVARRARGALSWASSARSRPTSTVRLVIAIVSAPALAPDRLQKVCRSICRCRAGSGAFIDRRQA